MEATTTRASTSTRLTPPSETRIHASITMPLSSTRSSTSLRLALPRASSALIMTSLVPLDSGARQLLALAGHYVQYRSTRLQTRARNLETGSVLLMKQSTFTRDFGELPEYSTTGTSGFTRFNLAARRVPVVPRNIWSDRTSETGGSRNVLTASCELVALRTRKPWLSRISLRSA